ncbi:MAG TPA: YbfB/YjiJ family MFS transporter [Salinisphaeraceae bacterium]|nr:YbfB/YjiJ family MFS transporter [Salinisphaeraceae bacterium]
MAIQSKTTAASIGMPLWVVAVLALGSAVALGWARFAYGLLLPSMQEALHWSYMVAGSLTTASTTGYLAGAMLASRIARRLGLQRSVMTGLAITTACLLGCAFVTSLPALLVLQLGGGFGGAMIFIIGSIVVANGASTRRRAALGLAIFVAGAGFGVAVAALSIPWLLKLPLAIGWRWGWVALAGFSAASLLAIAAVRDYFADGASQASERLPLRTFFKLAPITAAYSFYGVGYIGYMTFITALLQQQQGLSHAQMALVWAALGLASMATVFVWGYFFSRLRNGQSMALVLSVTTLGVALPLAGGGLMVALLSALLFGGAMLAAPPAITHFIRDTLPPAYWVSAMASITACFGVGQIIGPELVGYLADHGGGITAGFVASAASLGLGVIVALYQRPVAEHGHSGQEHLPNSSA